LSPEALARASLETEVVERVSAGALVLAPAALELDGAHIATVGPRVAGRVSSVAVSVGDRVRPGTVLARIESADVAAAFADAAAAKTTEQVARQNYERERALLRDGISAQRDVQAAEAELARATAARQVAEGRLNALNLPAGAVAATNELPLASPIGGTVVERSVVMGAPVTPTDVLFRIADLTSLWLVASVPETELRHVRRGQTVNVALDALPASTVNGRVSYVADAVRADTRTVDVRVVVPNADGRLKPGMFARARIETGEAANQAVSTITIPSSAVQRLAGATVVFVKTGEREFRARVVAAGENTGDRVVVVDGLNPGDVIVTRGSFILKAEAVRGQAGGER
jgi:cobalt-zinc-cadmium efflux system membrane fusion protein